MKNMGDELGRCQKGHCLLVSCQEEKKDLESSALMSDSVYPFPEQVQVLLRKEHAISSLNMTNRWGQQIPLCGTQLLLATTTQKCLYVVATMGQVWNNLFFH